MNPPRRERAHNEGRSSPRADDGRSRPWPMCKIARRPSFFGHYPSSVACCTIQSALESEEPMKTPHAPPMFANILQEGTLAEDVTGAMFLVLGAIPAAFFLLLAVLPPAPALCAD